MSFKRKIKNTILNSYSKLRIYSSRKNEIRKFEDSRRKEIYSKIELTDEQKKSIDKLYLENYGEKIPYTWHQHYTAFTGNFDVNYFPELLYIPEFEYFMNLNIEYAKVLKDKNFFPMVAEHAGVKTPKTILSKNRGIYIDKNKNILTEDEAINYLKNYGEAFAKPATDSCGGEGCRVVNFKDGIDLETGSNIKFVFNELGENFIIQERVFPSKQTSHIYPYSINTFRIITYIWKDKIEHCPITLKVGTGKCAIDNGHYGGIFIPIDDDGKLHKIGFTEFNEQFTEHPDTHLVFDGQKIDGIDKVLDAVQKLHSCVPQIGCINWDIGLDKDNEPMVIEANVCGGSIWIPQMVHGKGPFGDKTPEILHWIRLMKSLSCKERKNHMFGKM